MRQIILSCLFVLSASFLFAQSDPGNEAAIRSLIQQQGEAWNKNDMNEYCRFFTDDGSWINIGGLYWKNKRELLQAHLAFAPVLKYMTPATLSIQHIQFIAPDVALVFMLETIQMNHDLSFPDGRKVAVGDTIMDQLSLVLIKSSGHWFIKAGHNTAVDPNSVKINPVDKN
jgi:uncharacterized protein (TIGR02246 family)